MLIVTCTGPVSDFFGVFGGFIQRATHKTIRSTDLEQLINASRTFIGTDTGSKSTSVVKKRDVTLRGLIEYMGESGQELISDYYGKTESSVHEDLKICRYMSAVNQMQWASSLRESQCLLILEIWPGRYPPQLCKTFEVFQRLFVGLDTLRPKASSRFMTLKNKLLS
ncbi:Olfactory receptor 497 [Labeo rohita]|uniref:Olfactory receptor 497 n=1 Tax=Labeo rohita TaxID=84645 RepID=A0ABQ8KYT8_LABRO|nr:Olfactory receptor 497 [Labeo rohita]